MQGERRHLAGGDGGEYAGVGRGAVGVEGVAAAEHNVHHHLHFVESERERETETERQTETES